MKCCLAIDIGGTKIASALITGKIIEQRQQIRTPQDEAASGMSQALADIIQQQQGMFDSVAVASTGIINKGILTALNPKNLGGLAEFPLLDTIAEYTAAPIGLLNDVQAAAYAEYQLLTKKVENFVFITVSTGVGGGIILNGKLQTGPNGIAGHIGHTLADPNGPICGCGRQGCVEAIAAGRAIEATAAKWDDPCEPAEVFARFRQGVPQAVEVVQRSARGIANLIADLVIANDIQRVVLGGSVGLAEGYLPLVNSYLQQLPHFYQTEVVPAACGPDAGLLGAALWWQNELAAKQKNRKNFNKR
ncbi:ROK family protein [Testudinibacter sp. TR-2022]|uniref:N-acetylmannosamine kinase n=1 Tax=Testudinibacter sp. TR-2022 TaxID=2585029 RepID=UPI0011199F92|nr:N-acetylmannosamine kinase [Testudinibacter sp. TR-2022]TNH03427.1 ROK family protein [Pasteurellaceae bacterium Phil31]TNH07513.1 ROK family protein [Testudinibacter sp. TR-2022]TNH09034.1 ROK family protein [Testudinibacter sp. TR-2022]TNH13455.1 ROK family protein [Testudinibacter sp. TR-2022]TNH13763.1 ROK family protein [Testudinibacter sp. TR-2022]